MKIAGFLYRLFLFTLDLVTTESAIVIFTSFQQTKLICNCSPDAVIALELSSPCTLRHLVPTSYSILWQLWESIYIISYYYSIQLFHQIYNLQLPLDKD